jgi:hypothetical protein
MSWRSAIRTVASTTGRLSGDASTKLASTTAPLTVMRSFGASARTAWKPPELSGIDPQRHVEIVKHLRSVIYRRIKPGDQSRRTCSTVSGLLIPFFKWL